MKMKILCLSISLFFGAAASGASTVHLFIPRSVLADSMAPIDTVSAFDVESPLKESDGIRFDRFYENKEPGNNPIISSTIESVPVTVESSFTYSPFSSPESHLVECFEIGAYGRSFSGNKLFMNSGEDSILGSAALRIFRLSKLPWNSSIEASNDLAKRWFAQQIEKDFQAEAASGIIYLEN